MRSGLQRVPAGKRALSDYEEIAGAEACERLRALGQSLKGVRVVHVSAATPRGGCPEQLRAMLPLAADAGLDVEWRVLYGSAPFADVARDLYDGIQGGETSVDDALWDEYLEGMSATGVLDDCDVLVLHDPQTLGLLGASRDDGPRVVWRCHVDASEPEPATWDRLFPLLQECDWGVFSADGFWPPNLGGDVRPIAPAIDPLGPKNMDMPLRLAGHVLRSLGVDLTRPLVCNVARLDRWKDPHAVIDVFGAAKEKVPELQLVLVGMLPGEGPDDFRIAREVADYAEGVEDVRVLTSYTGVGDVEVGALQRVARVSLQHSLREGFGLAAAEALWKRTPVVGGTDGGIALQVADGESGFLTDDLDTAAGRVAELVQDPARAITLGSAGREHVRDRFLVTRLLEDELRLLQSVGDREPRYLGLVKVSLPDGKELDLPEGSSGADAARSIGEGLARAAIAIEAGGEILDLSAPLPDGATIRILTDRDPEALEVIRHDAAHVLATAVKELYPEVKISIGPPIDDGFYYDFDFPDGVKVGEDDLARIEDKMREHIKADEKFERSDISSAEALERFKAEEEPYKVELIEDLGVESVSLYQNGPFTDLCRGPHGPGTKRIKAVKLTSVAGAYWRGDSDRQMLTRIYGTAFFSKEQLEEHIQRIEEAKARDHRKLGRELGLFDFSPVSPGSTFWTPKGTTLYNQIVALNRQMQQERGYEEVKTPLIYESQLWETSGHWGKYKENIFTSLYEEREFGVKPMNCPGHCELFRLRRWSYRDLPFRCAEPGLLHRREPSGTLHGLLRVRHFIQDDAHVFCREDQVQDEVKACMDFGFDIYNMFGFPVHIELSTRPEPDKRLGDDAFWDKTEGMLEEALRAGGYDYTVAEGEGAFYAPKIDLHMTDSIGRSWQLGTVQLDYNLPERFGLSYTGSDNADHQPVMIHRALFGSFERFIGILLEHTAGELPLWLAPVQAAVLPIADRHNDYANSVAEQLREGGLRIEVDDRAESVGRKIRDAELQKVPYMLVVGDRDVDAGQVSVRRHREGDEGGVTVAGFAERIASEVESREG